MPAIRRQSFRVWRSLGSLFKRGERRGTKAQVRLIEAYQSVFRGEDGELVLSDLANASGFYRVTPAREYTDKEIWQQEGMRMLYARIFEHLALSDADLQALETAARREAAIDQTETGDTY